MSARVSKVTPPRAVGRNTQRRKMPLEVDLNVPPPAHCDGVGTSRTAPVVPGVPVVQQRVAPPRAPPAPIDVDSIDDDDVVVLSSPRAFVEAKNNSRRNRSRNNVVDVELVELPTRHVANNRNKRQRIPNLPIIDCESFVSPDIDISSVHAIGRNLAAQTRSMVPTPPPPPPPPPEPTFNCPICIGPLVEETSTKCGHIFCKACIKKSISAQAKCPTCRRKVTQRDTFRIYLPKTS